MKRNIALIGLALASTWMATAQDTPRQEVYLGYDMLRANSATNIPAFSANGGGGQYAFNVNSLFGIVGDIYAAHNGNVFGSFKDPTTGTVYPGGKIDNTTAFYQFGPRISLRHWSRVTVFGEMLLGAASAHASIPVGLPNAVNVPSCITVAPSKQSACNVISFTHLRAQTSQNTFAYLLGGGLDIKINKHMKFRPIEADLQYTRLQNLRDLQNKSQYGFRYSTGVNFTFGGAQ